MGMRVLVSFGRRHHVYGDTIAEAIEGSRPHPDVSLAGSERLAAEVSRPRPEVVISDRPKSGACAPARVEIPTGPDPVSRIRVGGGCRGSRNPSFAELLAVVDEAEGPPG